MLEYTAYESTSISTNPIPIMVLIMLGLRDKDFLISTPAEAVFSILVVTT